jgi:hypothetical protein
VWLQTLSVEPHSKPTVTFKETSMKTFYALSLAALIGLISPVAFADDATPVKTRPAKIQTTALNTGAATVPAKVSQQDKMRQCAKAATGKKGAERKTFMKGCLSKKKA